MGSQPLHVKSIQACGNLSDTHGEPYIDPVSIRKKGGCLQQRTAGITIALLLLATYLSIPTYLPTHKQVQFRRFLTEYGFKLSDEEAEELMRECGIVSSPGPNKGGGSNAAAAAGPGGGEVRVSQQVNRIYYHQYRSMLVGSK